MPEPTGAYAMTPYKISKGADRLRRRWQVEDESGQHRFARRAYTPESAVRLMARDVAFYERTGRKSLHQRRRLCSGQVWHREKEKRDVAEALAALRAEFGSSQKGDDIQHPTSPEGDSS
jgi:hypothetical protein